MRIGDIAVVVDTIYQSILTIMRCFDYIISTVVENLKMTSPRKGARVGPGAGGGGVLDRAGVYIYY